MVSSPAIVSGILMGMDSTRPPPSSDKLPAGKPQAAGGGTVGRPAGSAGCVSMETTTNTLTVTVPEGVSMPSDSRAMASTGGTSHSPTDNTAQVPDSHVTRKSLEKDEGELKDMVSSIITTLSTVVSLVNDLKHDKDSRLSGNEPASTYDPQHSDISEEEDS